MLSMQHMSRIIFTARPLNNIPADPFYSGFTQWGYGHHDRDLSARIRSSPEALKVSSSLRAKLWRSSDFS